MAIKGFTMLKEKTREKNSPALSRCEERKQVIDHGKILSPGGKLDAEIKENIQQALWKDDVIRALEYVEIDVRVQSGVVHLNGHIMSKTSLGRVESAIQTVAGIQKIYNHLVLDDALTLDISTALGELEHLYGCKFFTGVSHGVVSLNGTVSHEKEKLLAEQCAAGNPNVRGVINNIQITGQPVKVQDQPFLQPAIGQTIYFLDWVSGIVKQVLLNPNNRRVIAMVIQWKFSDQQDGKTRLTDNLIVVPNQAIRYLTKVSGFLYITSAEKEKYMEYSPDYFIAAENDWVAPYPYCAEDVLFPVSYQQAGGKLEALSSLAQSILLVKDQVEKEVLLANDSLGG
jgi:osmotically-inducible protein OsmY